MKIIIIIAALFTSICIAQDGNTQNTLEFGLFLQNTVGLNMTDVFVKCLSGSITNLEVGNYVNQPFVPGNYLWADTDELISSAYDASQLTGVDAKLCLSVGWVQMPLWCWAYQYGQLGVSDPNDISCYENMDIYVEMHGLLAERYKVRGEFASREGWGSWGVNRYNTFGESDLHFHPCGYDPILNEFYKLTVGEMKASQLAAAYKETRAEILAEDRTALVAISFMGQPYAENWPRDPQWVTGFGLGEFEPYMNLLFQQFTAFNGYNKYPDAIDWHAYPNWNDPLRFDSPGLWDENIATIQPWLANASLSQRSQEYDNILDSFGYTDCELMVLESGSTPFWSQVKDEWIVPGDQAVRGHIAFQLSTLAEMSASSRTTLLQFDTDIDEVTADPDWVPDNYTMRDWWNSEDDLIDDVFEAYSRMASLLTGKHFVSKVELPCGSVINQTIAVHSYIDPITQLKVHQIRTTFPTSSLSPTYYAQIPVSTRYINIIPSVGDIIENVDCGQFSPYSIRLAVSWDTFWIEELSSTRDVADLEQARVSLNGSNPVTDSSIEVLISGSSHAQGAIAVYDVAGRVVSRLPYSLEQNGSTTCRLTVSDFASGIYFIGDESSNGSDMVGITVLR